MQLPLLFTSHRFNICTEYSENLNVFWGIIFNATTLMFDLLANKNAKTYHPIGSKNVSIEF